ncbi:MAG: preprotein translocase subunit SecE [Deltaproteobacteria bacterium]|nr:preprotein translocase subunit SecE [Deltaproteobacteria bacterium]
MGKLTDAKQFVVEAKGELNKVTWPSKQQTISGTWVVILLSVALGVFLGVVDFGLSRLVDYVLK